MKPPNPAAAERILIVRMSHLGDLIHALPVWHAVRAAFPRAEMAFATEARFGALLDGLAPQVLFRRNGGLGAWLEFRRNLRGFAPTWAIDCQGNWKSAMATRLSGATRRSGLARADWREPGAHLLCNDLSQVAAAGPHAVDRQLGLAQHVTGSKVPASFDLALTAAEQAAGQASLAHDPARPAPLLLHLARPGDPRSWPAAHFVELARQAAASGRAVLVLGGPAEVALAAQLPTIDGVRYLVETPGLRPLAALFQAAAQAGAKLVACDSGPAHLAAAAGLSVHLLHGAQDPARTGPWPQSAHQTQTSPRLLSCRPCLKRTCANAKGQVCMTDLAPSEVLRALNLSE